MIDVLLLVLIIFYCIVMLILLLPIIYFANKDFKNFKKLLNIIKESERKEEAKKLELELLKVRCENEPDISLDEKLDRLNIKLINDNLDKLNDEEIEFIKGSKIKYVWLFDKSNQFYTEGYLEKTHWRELEYHFNRWIN